MKTPRLCQALAISAIVCQALANAHAATPARTWELPLPEAADVFAEPADIEWAQGESLCLAYTGAPAADGAFVRWEVADKSNLWISAEATAAGGDWLWTLAPTQTCLPAGRYAGRVALYAASGTNCTFHRVAALQSIRVHASPAEGMLEADPLATNVETWVRSVFGELVAEKVDAAIATNEVVATHAAAIGANAEAIAGLRGSISSNEEAIAEGAAALSTLSAEVAAHPTNAFALSAAMQEQVCSMDIFEVDFSPRLSDVGTTNETTARIDSIIANEVETTEYAGYLLTADIQASKSESNSVSYNPLWNGTVFSNGSGEAFFHVDDGGNFGNLQAIFGEAVRYYLNVPKLTNDAVKTNYVYAGDASGSLREAFNAMTNSVDSTGERGYLAGGDFFLGTNWSFECISTASSESHPFQATLVAPRVAIVAGHCAPPVGTDFRWDWGDGSHKTASVLKRRSKIGDCCVVLLDDYVAAPTALMLDGKRAFDGNLTLPDNVSGVPGLYVASFHKGASGSVSRVMADIGENFNTIWILPATNALPAEVAGVDYVGGDSSSPVFLLPSDTNAPILLSCAHVSYGEGHGGGGPNWASPENWTFLTNSIVSMADEAGITVALPELYDLTPWPTYAVPPVPATTSESEEESEGE